MTFSLRFIKIHSLLLIPLLLMITSSTISISALRYGSDLQINDIVIEYYVDPLIITESRYQIVLHPKF